MKKFIKKIGLSLIVVLVSGILFWVAPAFANAAQTATVGSEISLEKIFPEIKSVQKIVRVGDQWVMLSSGSRLYSFGDQLKPLSIPFPEKYSKNYMAITDISSFYGTLTITATRYPNEKMIGALSSHFFFADKNLASLWELEVPDTWRIQDVYFGPQTLMFRVDIANSNRVELYNYLWSTKERLLVSSFAGYADFKVLSNDLDEWIIRACAEDRCDWFTYSANKQLSVLENLPYTFEVTDFAARPYDFVLIGQRDGLRIEQGYKVDGASVTSYEERALDQVAADVPHTDSLGRSLVFKNRDEDRVMLVTPRDGDKDGLSDELEARYGSDPKKADTDGDGFTDFLEVARNFNPSGPCQIKSYLPGDFKYGRGFVTDEVHKCYMADFDTQAAHALGSNWMQSYGVDWDRYADYVFGYIYGDYPIGTLIGAIKRENGFSNSVRYTEFKKTVKK